MHITLASSSSPITLFLPQTSPWPRKSICIFPSKRPCRQHRILRLSAKCFCRPPNLIRLMPAGAGGRRITEASNAPNSSAREEKAPTANVKTHLLKQIAKHMAFTLVCIVIGLCPITGFQYSAIAGAPATAQVSSSTKRKGKDTILKQKGHMYSDYTRTLLETVSVLVRCIEEVKSGNADIDRVQETVKDVKLKKEELQGQIMNRLYTELHKLNTEKQELLKRSLEIYDSAMKAKKEGESLLKKKANGGDVKRENMTKLEEEVTAAEKEYNEILEAVEEIEDQISRAEFMAFSVGIRELSSIERESESLAKNFIKKKRWHSGDSEAKGSLTKLSRADVQKELQSAQRLFLEQMILPTIVEAEYTGHNFDQDSVEFAQCIKRVLKTSRELQGKLEADVRRSMKKFGDEKLFVVGSPPGEVTKGFPEAELKWMFGDKEIVVPKASKLRLYHGWKKWREEAKADLKRKLLEDADFAKSYVAEKQERVLLDRDRVASKTWYNDKQKRWEIDPMAVPYAVSRKLVENARIRHDWAVMYITLKGDEHEYFVNIKDYDMHFENSGGIDELYLRMLASGIPTSVQLMWIPFFELDIREQFLLILRVSEQTFTAFWNFRFVSYAREWALKKIRNITDDIMMMIVFPIVEFVIPYPIRMQLGMAWPEYINQTVGSTWYLKWQSEAEMSFRSRKTDDFKWFIWFVVRSAIYGYIVLNVIRFMRRKIPRLLGYGPLRSKDPNFKKLDRVKSYFKHRVRKIKSKRKDGVDPISTAFDQMKRVKNPPICLNDFASVDSMKEEINEVVAFLQNPKAFQEMGARAPRGVLIVGERGTGKTSLALAIAAEAKVPIVEVKAQQLEPGLWVGQSASNVRELFQTARDLAPVIIFVEDFDLFAGVRGTLLHTKKQDHEAFINQLLVELDGFEKQDGVLLMATTRNLKQIDEALQRPGRMDRVFHLQRPTQLEREKILKVAAKENMDEELINYVDWRKVAEKTALLRPIELKLVPMALEGSAFRSKFVDVDELLSYCSWFATFSCHIPRFVWNSKIVKNASKMLVNHLGLTLTKEDLQSVVDLMEPYGQISNGMELANPPLEWTKETKFPHAVWAAGRGLIAYLLPNFDVVDNIWLEPLSWEGIGCTKITKAKNGGSLNGNVESRSYLEKKLVFCFGSYVASQLLLPFGEENILSSSELKQAQEIATRMVIQYGWGPDGSPVVYHHANAATPLSMGKNHEYEMATKIEKMYDLAYNKARGLLEKNRSIMEKIVEELIEYEILSGKDLERIFAENGGIQEKEPFFLSNNHEQHSVTRDNLENGSALLIAAN
ncbi:probable inactive ATP-dependent zinc metalloprotease FTSHI 5, chloroplastic [Impatiens glandulifera]|uniref:probable inactive ATP-dependent zinc metalloprotease FTSHI 5, chloroplastic n=1 Tax=Impatiens glandulifera TaxID=253017 RepID=UPI001FB04DB1|nr:probable inactive ATP-dependent zinc metalloprotease FTSHI 5, chloroplastic [Impatiens glandulifera]